MYTLWLIELLLARMKENLNLSTRRCKKINIAIFTKYDFKLDKLYQYIQPSSNLMEQDKSILYLKGT